MAPITQEERDNWSKRERVRRRLDTPDNFVPAPIPNFEPSGPRRRPSYQVSLPPLSSPEPEEEHVSKPKASRSGRITLTPLSEVGSQAKSSIPAEKQTKLRLKHPKSPPNVSPNRQNQTIEEHCQDIEQRDDLRSDKATIDSSETAAVEWGTKSPSPDLLRGKRPMPRQETETSTSGSTPDISWWVRGNCGPRLPTVSSTASDYSSTLRGSATPTPTITGKKTYTGQRPEVTTQPMGEDHTFATKTVNTSQDRPSSEPSVNEDSIFEPHERAQIQALKTETRDDNPLPTVEEWPEYGPRPKLIVKFKINRKQAMSDILSNPPSSPSWTRFTGSEAPTEVSKITSRLATTDLEPSSKRRRTMTPIKQEPDGGLAPHYRRTGRVTTSDILGDVTPTPAPGLREDSVREESVVYGGEGPLIKDEGPTTVPWAQPARGTAPRANDESDRESTPRPPRRTGRVTDSELLENETPTPAPELREESMDYEEESVTINDEDSVTIKEEAMEDVRFGN